MMAGMDDRDDIEDDITLEAMEGLSKILAQIDESHIRAILINISLKIRPCFEKDKGSVRAAAFTLFGNLSRFGDGPSMAPFLEQIHTNFVSLLLHLNDPEKEVIKACKYALRHLGPLIGSKSMNDMFQRHLLEDASLHYGEFVNDLSKVIIADFPDKVNFYVMGNVSFFKSMWSEIRSNAAMFAGFLMGNLPKEKHHMVSKEHICGALIILLKDPSPDVRSKSAEAMSWLFDY